MKDFEDEFVSEKIENNKRREKIFDPKQKAAMPRIDLKKELTEKMADKSRKGYSVYEDKVLIECMRSLDGNQSISSMFEQVSGKLMNRSFDSVKERYKKWIKRFSDGDLDKVIDFCKGKQRVVLESFMLKRRVDEKKGIVQLAEIVPMDVGLKYGYNKHLALEEEEEQVENQNQVNSVLADSPRFGKVSEKSVDVNKAIALMPDSAKKFQSVISDLNETIKESPKKEHFITIDTNRVRRPLEDDSVLGKRDPIVVPMSDMSQLKHKAESFKASLLSSDESIVAYNSAILFKLLRHLASYHQIRVSDVVSRLDENKELDMSALRFELCNRTAIDIMTESLN